ncbi:unnamed protein product [Fraxinus pennsylvanica]|uniref:WRKY domain-containing protein n=1 Tax=Fraxinus pennsylvanica TaxID=56036 RepID=A0AAD2E111_9LAMI|nr:unnamed protein product [Fraxinus pennsylvanica]
MAENYPNTNMPGSTMDPYKYQMNLEHSDFFEFNDWTNDDLPLFVSGYPGSQTYAANDVVNSGGSSSYHEDPNATSGDSRRRRENKEITEKVAFKTKSEIEILDDGFKWRKYGKKMVKNSPNPRNYYRCSVEGCPVKKRVERDAEDQRQTPSVSKFWIVGSKKSHQILISSKTGILLLYTPTFLAGLASF